MKSSYEQEITENISNDRNLVLLGVRADADIEHLNKRIAELERDAARYRFLRDENNWGEDSGADCWGILGESHAAAFDDVVDSRMAKSA